MVNIKKHKIIARSIVVAGTLLASLGIWTSVANHPDFSQATAQDPAPITADVSPEYSSDPGMLATTGDQTAPAAPPPTQPLATIPAATAPPTAVAVVPLAVTPTPAPVQTTPPAATPVKPTPAPTIQPSPTPATVKPTPTQPVPTRTPRLRTRAS